MGASNLVRFLRDVAFHLFPKENTCWIAHDKLNHRALGASRAAGFRYVQDFVEEGIQQELLLIEKQDVAAISQTL